MTLVNPNPYPTLHEYPRHFKSKVRVGKLADRYFTVKYAGLELQRVWTHFEYPYSAILTDRGPRTFTGDIVIFLDHQAGRYFTIDRVIDIEIDDHKHNNKKKDDFRDMCLKEIGAEFSVRGITRWPIRVKIPTLRIPGDLKNIDDAVLEQELDKFCEKHKIIPLEKGLV